METDIECPICLEEEKNIVRFACKHMICKGCFTKYVAALDGRDFDCPICRSPVVYIIQEVDVDTYPGLERVAWVILIMFCIIQIFIFYYMFSL